MVEIKKGLRICLKFISTICYRTRFNFAQHDPAHDVKLKSTHKHVWLPLRSYSKYIIPAATSNHAI